MAKEINSFATVLILLTSHFEQKRKQLLEYRNRNQSPKTNIDSDSRTGLAVISRVATALPNPTTPSWIVISSRKPLPSTANKSVRLLPPLPLQTFPTGILDPNRIDRTMDLVASRKPMTGVSICSARKEQKFKIA